MPFDARALVVAVGVMAAACSGSSDDGADAPPTRPVNVVLPGAPGETSGAGVEAGLRLVAALWKFWAVRGHWQEQAQWLETLFARAGPALDARVRARALVAASNLAWGQQGDPDRATALAEESRALFQELGDQRGVAAATS